MKLQLLETTSKTGLDSIVNFPVAEVAKVLVGPPPSERSKYK